MKATNHRPPYYYLKRFSDLFLAATGTIILSPLFFIVIVLIKVEDHGPAFFIQTRTGKNGKEFKMYKFRSMAIDNNVYDFEKTNQLTKVGKIIRNTSIDELPQLFNIIRGEMSFIGPRPWIPDYYKKMNQKQRRRFEVLPGITGLAQASGRNNLTVHEKIKYDIQYVDNFSLKQDIKVIFMTIKTIFSKDGSYAEKDSIKAELDELNNR